MMRLSLPEGMLGGAGAAAAASDPDSFDLGAVSDYAVKLAPSDLAVAAAQQSRVEGLEEWIGVAKPLAIELDGDPSNGPLVDRLMRVHDGISNSMSCSLFTGLCRISTQQLALAAQSGPTTQERLAAIGTALHFIEKDTKAAQVGNRLLRGILSLATSTGDSLALSVTGPLAQELARKDPAASAAHQATTDAILQAFSHTACGHAQLAQSLAQFVEGDKVLAQAVKDSVSRLRVSSDLATCVQTWADPNTLKGLVPFVEHLLKHVAPRALRAVCKFMHAGVGINLLNDVLSAASTAFTLQTLGSKDLPKPHKDTGKTTQSFGKCILELTIAVAPNDALRIYIGNGAGGSSRIPKALLPDVAVMQAIGLGHAMSQQRERVEICAGVADIEGGVKDIKVTLAQQGQLTGDQLLEEMKEMMKMTAATTVAKLIEMGAIPRNYPFSPAVQPLVAEALAELERLAAGQGCLQVAGSSSGGGSGEGMGQGCLERATPKAGNSLSIEVWTTTSDSSLVDLELISSLEGVSEEQMVADMAFLEEVGAAAGRETSNMSTACAGMCI